MVRDVAAVPVIIGVGEVIDRPATLEQAREPADLMAAAMQRAAADAGVPLDALDGLHIINEISWPYPDPVGTLIEKLGLAEIDATYHPVGGQTPLLAIHEASLAIQAGRWRLAAVCGAEAQKSVSEAQRSNIQLPWSPRIENFQPVRGADYQRPVARMLDLATPTNVYPLYENATRAAWRQSFAEAQAESAQIWARNAGIAQARESAWLRVSATPDAIATPTDTNRLIAWPYTKMMTANPNVNQGAAILVCSLELALELGVDASKIIYIHAGAAADEPRDYLNRADYHRSPAMEAVLGAVQGSAAHRFDHVELYSCFPCVPKMARRTLGISGDEPLSVAGGLTFFGAPLNNYMSHATAAMVERLRANGGTGLLYGQGEYVTKHHALVLGQKPGPDRLDDAYRLAPAARVAPPFDAAFEGPARIETFTVLFDRDGGVRHGAVIVLGADGRRTLARVPPSDENTLRHLLSRCEEPVGTLGRVERSSDGLNEWRLGAR